MFSRQLFQLSCFGACIFISFASEAHDARQSEAGVYERRRIMRLLFNMWI